MQNSDNYPTPPKEPPSMTDVQERKRLEFEALAKLPLSRPQLKVVCVNYGAEIRQLPNTLKTA